MRVLNRYLHVLNRYYMQVFHEKATQSHRFSEEHFLLDARYMRDRKLTLF